MTSVHENRPVRDEQLFDLLEHPEQWPDDPAVQAELASLLELHLALRAHPDDLDAALTAQAPRPWYRRSSWMQAAAAVLIATVPTLYAVQHARYLREKAQDSAHREALAQARTSNRLWARFLDQSAELLRDLEKGALVCHKDGEFEDRSAERELAALLLEKSHQLASQGAPLPGAEDIRTNLHAFLTELSLEDGCMAPARAEELRTWAKSHNLSQEVERLSKLLSGDAS